jgi:DNA polymerase I-like protein with 3'-5' exonuclease and polymerase domains
MTRLPFPTTTDTHWTPPTPPSLGRVATVAVDLETTGLQWWAKDRPIGIAVTSELGTCYLPFGHRGGGNLDEAVVKRWAQTELRHKHILNLNTRFDVHFLREWGVDLEDQGCTVSDVAHSAALLDDGRKRFSLDILARDFLGQEKVGKDLDATRMADYHAGDVAPRAEADTRQVWELEQLFKPQLAAENLQRVKQLENQIIFVVCEMEKNGCPIDLYTLNKWLHDSGQAYLRLIWNLYRDTGLNVNPQRPTDLIKLCQHLKLPVHDTPDGRPSFTDAVLSTYDHPIIDRVRRARKLASLRSKYLVKYKEAVDDNGLLRYALHQLRVDEGGTVSGRFSSSALQRGVGVNIQQVPSVAKQTDAMGEEYLIRTLHRPAAGRWLSADAAQIEYRLFADMAKNPTVLAAYRNNPALSFHHVVWEELKKHKADLQYKDLKALNFAKLYGAGTARIAEMLGYITADQHATLRRTHAGSDHPLLRAAQAVMNLYDRVLPEVDEMLKRATSEAQLQGYVTTALGRRARLAPEHGYRALNRQIQGTAADVMKQKLVHLHHQRKHTGFLLRFTVHDEVDGDCPDEVCRDRVQTILNAPSTNTTVPLIWDVSLGDSWGACD